MIISSKLHRSAVIAVGCATLLGLGGLVTAATAVASTTPVRAGSQLAAEPWTCEGGHFCIYDGWNGTGESCPFLDRKVSNTAGTCTFIQNGKPVRSVYNRTEHRVQYYTGTNYNKDTRVGSTPPHDGGNLQGDYQIRSFQPQ